MMSGTVPIFLQPTRNHLGIIGPIPLQEFSRESIARKIEANPLIKDKSARPPGGRQVGKCFQTALLYG